MNSIQFTSVSAEGFRSIVYPLEFNLNRPAGLNLIRGANGVGKTTIFEALVWGLYGVNLKDTVQDKIPSWEEVRTSKWAGTRVIVKFVREASYEVCRHINYQGNTGQYKAGDRLMVFKDGVLQGETLNKDETQELIIKLIGVDSKTFLNSVLFGQRMAKLIAQDNKDKRDLFEQLFDMDWVKDIKEVSDNRIADMNALMTTLTTEETVLKSKHASLLERIEINENLLLTFHESQRTQIDKKSEEGKVILDEIKGLQKEVEELQKSSFKDISKKNKELQDINAGIQLINLQVAELNTRYSAISAICESQGGQLDDMEQTIASKQSDLDNFDTNQAEKAREINGKKVSVQSHIETLTHKLTVLRAELKQSPTKTLESTDEKLALLKASKATLDAEVQTYNSTIDAAKEKVEEQRGIDTELGAKCYACGQELREGNVLSISKSTEISECNTLIRETAVLLDAAEEKLVAIERGITMFTGFQKFFTEYAAVEKELEKNKLLLQTFVVQESSGVKDLLIKTIEELQANYDGLLVKYNTNIEKGNQIAAERKTLKESLDPLVDKQSELNKIISDFDSLQTTIATKTSTIENKTLIMNEIAKSIKAIREQAPPEFNIDGMKEEAEKIEQSSAEKRTEIVKLQDQLDIAKWWSSKALGASGIKSFIFKSMLSKLNENVLKYGDRLGVSMEFTIDLSKASKPFSATCSIGNKLNKDYKEFSGGQKQRLDIVLIFAMYDLISINISTNIILMDEILEGLDEEGEAAVFDLIRMKAEEGKTIYVITHSPLVDSLYSKTINITYDNSTTKIIE